MNWKRFLLTLVALLFVVSYRVHCQDISPEEAWGTQVQPLELILQRLGSANTILASNAVHEFKDWLKSTNATQLTLPEKAMEALGTNNDSARLDAVVALDQQRERLIGQLIAILYSTNSVKVKAYAAIVLGQYRTSEAVPILVNHLEWDEVAAVHVGASDQHPYPREKLQLEAPVFTALIHIGMPALPAVLDKIAETDEPKVTDRCVRICFAIEGMEVTHFRLAGLLQKADDDKHKRRFQSALAVLEDLEARARNIHEWMNTPRGRAGEK
jgi:HEAT repeat protein